MTLADSETSSHWLGSPRQIQIEKIVEMNGDASDWEPPSSGGSEDHAPREGPDAPPREDGLRSNRAKARKRKKEAAKWEAIRHIRQDG